MDYVAAGDSGSCGCCGDNSGFYFCTMHGAAAKMQAALDNLVGPGGQHEFTCDKAEHDQDSKCIFCEARKALAESRPGLVTG